MKPLATACALVLLTSGASAQTTSLNGKMVKFIGDDTYENCWKFNNPSGPSDYFSNDYDSGCAGLTVCAVAVDVCETSSGGSNGDIGVYPDNLAVDPAGHTPDLANPITSLPSPTGLPGTFCSGLTGYDVPDVTLGSTGVHAVYGSAPGDSSVWLCADSTTARGRSYFSFDGYATPAIPFTVNWACYIASPVLPGTFTINGGSTAKIDELDTVTFHFEGNPGVNGEAWFIFLSNCAGAPVKLVLPLVFLTNVSPPDNNVGGPFPCNVFTGKLCFLAVWQNTVSGKFELSNEVSLTVNQGLCGYDPCPWGQKDDGILDVMIWKVQNPSGTGDWFNVHMGTRPSLSGTITGVELASWTFCGVGPCWDEVGVYEADLTLDPTGGTPNVTTPITSVGGASACMGPGQSDWSYPATFYDTPDVAILSSIDYHAAVKWATGDSCIWMASDSDAFDSPCGTIPQTTSYFTSDGYTSNAIAGSNGNWMIKIDWR